MQLFEHQQQARDFAVSTFRKAIHRHYCDKKPLNCGSALLMEMGCGKTVTAIAISQWLYENQYMKRMLIVAPLSILSVWEEELQKFAEFPYTLHLLKGTSQKKQKEITAAKSGQGLQIVIVNYESAWRLEKELLSYDADLIICDEAHKLKDGTTSQSKAIFNDRYYGKHVAGDSYPWCAAFVYCIFEECGASDLFYDGKKTAYCPAIHEWGKKRNLIVPTSEGQYGDIVLFDWNGDSVADHVGFIITRNGNGTYETVEGNTATYNYTNGGYVLKMTRYYSSIIAIIRPQYGTTSDNTKGTDTVKTKLKVIDVSEHQGRIDWNRAKNNIDGAIIRCGYGDDIMSQDDKQYANNLSECERLKIPHGVYLYSYAVNDAQAKSELAHILRLIKGHKFEYPIFLDCEQAGTESYAEKACKIICGGLIAAGYKAGVYSSLYWWNNYLSSVTEYTRWVAQWASACTYNGDYLMWQYGTDKVDGIGTAVDMNYLYEYNESTQSPENPKTEDVIKPEITYQVFTDTSGWLPAVRNLEDYAGIDGQPIKGIRVYLNGDTLAVQTHQMANGNIDKLTIYAGKNTIRYRVRTIGSKDYLSWMENKKDTGGSTDTFAGEAGKPIDRIQIAVK